jgi:hypothetical protein
MRNPPEEFDLAGNYQLINKESSCGMEFFRELPAYFCGFRPVRSKFVENPLNGNNSRISRSKSSIPTMPTLKKKFLRKSSIKLKINLILPY